jgi:hypothetical protein
VWSVGIALGVGLASIAAAIAVVLSRSPVEVLSTNSIPGTSIVAATKGGVGTCQGRESVPRGTSAVRLWVTGNVKPAVRIEVLAGLEPIASGEQQGGWLGKVVTVPIEPIASAIRDATICVRIDRAVEEIDLLGSGSAHPAPGESPGKVRVEYLRLRSSSWWSLAGSVSRSLGFGRAPAGRYVFLIPLLAMVLAALLVSWTLFRYVGRGRRGALGPIAGGQTPLAQTEQRERILERPPTPAGRSRGSDLARRWAGLARRVPGPAWACACVALLSATSWSVVSPPFEVTDEPAHFAYAQILAETHSLPKSQADPFSLEESVALRDLDQSAVHFNQAIGTISTGAQQARLQRDLARPYSQAGEGAGVASTEPPLYYALQAIPYLAGSSGTLLDRLELMRLLSALCGAIAAIFIFLFLREALPAIPWAWTVGGLCAALAPLLGFISGAVNPDAMLCAVSAALFYCLARAFARGLTTGMAVAIGAVIATGFLTKLNFIGLVPGATLALVLLTRRVAHTSGRGAAYRRLALALAIGWSPVCVYVLVNLASHHAALGIVSRNIGHTDSYHRSLLRELSYIWQSYLPRLPGMRSYFPGVSTIRQLWFDRLVGLYGWLDAHFPNWVYDFALIPSGLLALLCGRELARGRSALRARAGELIAYASIGVGLLALIGADSYLEYPLAAGAYSEPRYMLPLTAIFAAMLALAARGAGRRWGPAVGTLLVLLFLGYDILSQLQVIARYYG